MPAGNAGEGRLAAGLVAEDNFAGRNASVAGEDEAEAGAASDETSLVLFEDEPGGALALAIGEDGGEFAEGRVTGREGNVPDVNLPRAHGVAGWSGCGGGWHGWSVARECEFRKGASLNGSKSSASASTTADQA